MNRPKTVWRRKMPRQITPPFPTRGSTHSANQTLLGSLRRGEVKTSAWQNRNRKITRLATKPFASPPRTQRREDQREIGSAPAILWAEFQVMRLELEQEIKLFQEVETEQAFNDAFRRQFMADHPKRCNPLAEAFDLLNLNH